MVSPQYLISDLHLDHGNIIDYCDRPFESTETMNEALVSNWNQQVDPDDTVVFVGDLTIPWSGTDPHEWLDRLNGEVVFICGNHDEPKAVTTRDQYRFEIDGYRFHCVHWPENVPRNWSGWSIHGHHHNNYPDEFPFLDPANRSINVSVGLVDYRPVSVERLVTLVKRGDRLEQLPENVGQ